MPYCELGSRKEGKRYNHLQLSSTSGTPSSTAGNTQSYDASTIWSECEGCGECEVCGKYDVCGECEVCDVRECIYDNIKHNFIKNSVRFPPNHLT